MAARKKAVKDTRPLEPTSVSDPKWQAAKRRQAIKAIRDGRPFLMLWQEVTDDGIIREESALMGLSSLVIMGWIEHWRAWETIERPMRQALAANAETVEATVRRMLAECPACSPDKKE